MKTLFGILYTLFVCAVCSAIVIFLMKYVVNFGIFPIILLLVCTIPFSVVTCLIDKHVVFAPYFILELSPTGVYTQFFFYFAAFILSSIQLWINYWQHDGHWILSCIFGTALYWFLLATKGNDLVQAHKMMGRI